MAKIIHSILIIDDEKEILKALERTLRSVAQIYTAPSGAAGLKILKKKDISLILCDQRMPEMTGINFFKKIHKEYPDVIRIILTAYTDIEDLIEAINKVGLYRYITKPWDNRELQLVIKRALERFDLQRHNRKLIKELKIANTGLEKKVAERTKALKEANKRLKNLSITDELTQVGNQRYFKEQLQHELERSKRYKHALSLLLIDLDYFKFYNDEHGHIVGDRALKTIAQTLNNNIRNTDILARYGGEEFVIILPETNKKRALELAERLRKSISKNNFPFKVKRHKKKGLTVSIGVSSFPEDVKSTSIKPLFQKADKGLYRAKRKGRNCVMS